MQRGLGRREIQGEDIVSAKRGWKMKGQGDENKYRENGKL